MTKFHPTSLYSPKGQMYTCLSADEFEQLVAAGWKGSPLDHEKPYTPEQARWVQYFHQVEIEEAAPAEVESAASPPAPSSEAPSGKKRGR